MIVDVVQVVQNHEQSLARITAAEVAEGFADVQDPFATAKQATEAVGVHILESQKLFDSLQTAVDRAHAPGLLLPGPSDTADRFQIQRTPFVETHYRAVRWTAPIERPDAFFYGRTRNPSKSSKRGQMRPRQLDPARRAGRKRKRGPWNTRPSFIDQVSDRARRELYPAPLIKIRTYSR
jgi:hypothetical protein